MSDSTVALTPVQGTDGEVPIYNPTARFQIFKLSELYRGLAGLNKYVGNVGDLVLDTEDEGIYPMLKVSNLSAELIPTLTPWNTAAISLLTDGDLLTGVGPSSHNTTKRAFLDRSVLPYVLAVDNRLSYKGTTARYARIIRGNASDVNPTVISSFYDNQGNLLGQDIPLELVQVGNGVARNEYAVPVCYTMEDLPDNEPVTIIAFSTDGHVVSKDQLLIENTSYIRSRNTAIKYIDHISMTTPFMSETDSTVINLPLNVNLSGLFPVGRVHFSDGSIDEMPVDGGKFTLQGMGDFLSSYVNQKVPVVLKYSLSAEEVAYGAQRVGDRYHISEKYNVITIAAKGAYNVKLYGYPEWIDSVQGYTLRWWLYNSDRAIRYDVTDKVRFATNSQAFQPTLYGAAQSLNVQLTLSEVNPIYENWRYAQTVQITLWREGLETSTNWTVQFTPNQSPAYGEGNYVRLEFINFNHWKLNLSGGSATQAEWLEKFYTRIQPLIDPDRETGEAPLPTHFRLRYGTQIEEYSIDDWNTTLQIVNGYEVGKTLYFEWLRKTAETTLEMGIAGVPIYAGSNL